MISIIITSFKEPRTICSAIEVFEKSKIRGKFEVIVVAPDKETIDSAKTLTKKYKNLRVIKDSGKGKSAAMNLVVPKAQGDIIIFSDGDVKCDENASNELIKHFKNEKV